MKPLLVKHATHGKLVYRINSATSQPVHGHIVGKVYHRLGIACVSVRWGSADDLEMHFVKTLYPSLTETER